MKSKAKNIIKCRVITTAWLAGVMRPELAFGVRRDLRNKVYGSINHAGSLGRGFS
jgi:hypothetical protein